MRYYLATVGVGTLVLALLLVFLPLDHRWLLLAAGAAFLLSAALWRQEA
jgi:hypothetical protein